MKWPGLVSVMVKPRSCLSLWWCLHAATRLPRWDGPPSVWGRRWARSQVVALRRHPGARQVLSRARTNAASAAVGRRLVWPWLSRVPVASVTENRQAGLVA